MDLSDHMRARECEQIPRAHERVGMILEALPAVIFFGKAIGLDHRAHAAVEDQHASGQLLAESGDTVGGGSVSPTGGEGRLWAG